VTRCSCLLPGAERETADQRRTRVGSAVGSRLAWGLVRGRRSVAPGGRTDQAMTVRLAQQRVAMLLAYRFGGVAG
jgi:hypothetical protein